MKKIITTVFMALAVPLMALRPGDVTARLEYRTKWLNAVPFPLGKLEDAPGRKVPQLRGMVFIRTRTRASAMVIPALEAARRKYSGNLLIAAVTPDNESDARSFADKFEETRIRFVLDSEKRLTPLFMGGSTLFPMAFLINKAGKIIWRGEAIDLPEAAERYFTGTLPSPGDERKISGYIDEMLQRMRTAEVRPLRSSADKIFKLDPGNASAMRMLLFALESAGDIKGAWELCAGQIKASGHRTRLYFTALDLIRRYPQLRTGFLPLLEQFRENAATAEDLFAMANLLMQSFAGDAAAIEMAGRMLHNRDFTPAHLTARQQLQLSVLLAGYEYLICNIDGAVKLQSQALALAQKDERFHREKEAVQRKLEFYKKISELNKKRRPAPEKQKK